MIILLWSNLISENSFTWINISWMKRQLSLLSLCGLLLLAWCDTSNPMRQPLPVTTWTQTQTQTVVQTPVVKPTNTPTPAPVSNSYTMQDVKKHNTSSDCWTVINGKIYNMSSFASQHSGGPSSIDSTCGKDGTSVYARQHWSSTSLIRNFFVANLQ